MTDKELIELAAKAAGISIEYRENGNHFASEPVSKIWNPLTDDGDVARLEAALGIDVNWTTHSVRACTYDDTIIDEKYSDHGGDEQKARRYASTRAAAEIGREQP